MSERNSSLQPYEQLGRRLKRMRISRQETLAEVSGAVEIDVQQLSVFEKGEVRPNEEILDLLISHFELKDEEADKLWKLAGYDAVDAVNTEPESKQVMALNLEDLKIVYTDMVHITVNDFGVIMNFMQGGGPHNPPLAIARVGMSRQHAQSMLELLQKTLGAQQKQLPLPKVSDTTQ